MFRKSGTTIVDSKFMIHKIKQKDSVKKLFLVMKALALVLEHKVKLKYYL